jgi:hypothetical protein
MTGSEREKRGGEDKKETMGWGVGYLKKKKVSKTWRDPDASRGGKGNAMAV